jgi:hypothetical protein
MRECDSSNFKLISAILIKIILNRCSFNNLLLIDFIRQ